jgi:phosphate transport system substrate-binding protein
MKLRFTRVVALFGALALILAACSPSSGEETTTSASGGATTTAGSGTTSGGEDMSPLGLPIIDPLDVTPGDIAIAGSSTVFPLSVAVMNQWEDEGGPNYPIDSIGSGGGFERFCVEGASDIANASRAIKEEEVAACAALTPSRTPIEIRLGTDALSLVISSGNTFATELTLEEIAAAFSAQPGTTWADINPEFPAHPIALFSPGADSGTFDYFNEVVFPEETEAEEPSPILSSIANIVGEDDNVTVQGVAEDGCTEGDLSSTCAIGYFGYAYYAENSDVLVAVAVDAGDGPVAPSADSVNDNSYPISRPLFMYTDAGVITEKPQVAEFIAYYLNNVDDLIGDVGYFPAPDDALQEAADHIKAAAGW